MHIASSSVDATRERAVRVSVRLFAGLHDLVGRREVELELVEGATVADLREQLASQYPAVAPLMSTLVCAVNEEYAPNEHRLSPGDQVALIPPVSGGSSAGGGQTAARPGGSALGGGAEADRFQVTQEPLDPPRLANLVRRDESGALALFYGVVRNHSQGRRVLYLEYDAYPSMAVKKMQQVAEEARSRWDITEMAIHHRIGRLEVGETSLLVAVSAPHRREAFEACHYAVDRIKEIVPVWKKEVWEGGESWVEGHPVAAAGPGEPGSSGPARRPSRLAKVAPGEGAAPEKK
jgi:molybdopterin synthase catalytic subunit